MDTTLLIEADGQPSVTITIAADPDIIFQDTGVQGPPGAPGVSPLPDEVLAGFDPGDLTLTFDNRLL